MLLQWFRAVDDYRISGSEPLKDHEECAPIFDRNLWQQRQKVILSHRKTRNTKFTNAVRVQNSHVVKEPTLL